MVKALKTFGTAFVTLGGIGGVFSLITIGMGLNGELAQTDQIWAFELVAATLFLLISGLLLLAFSAITRSLQEIEKALTAPSST